MRWKKLCALALLVPTLGLLLPTVSVAATPDCTVEYDDDGICEGRWYDSDGDGYGALVTVCDGEIVSINVGNGSCP